MNSRQEHQTRAKKNGAAEWMRLPALMVAINVFASAPAFAQVACFVNGSPITNFDIEQRSKFTLLSTHKSPTRKETLDSLTEEKIKAQEASRYSMTPQKADIDRAVANMASRAGMSADQFVQLLAGKGIGIETIRTRMEAEIAWGQLVRARFPMTLSIEEKEIREAIEGKGGEGDAVAYDYQLREILFIVPKGSPESVFEGRKREAEALRERFQDCQQGIAFARSLRDVAVRDSIRRGSSDLPENLRNLLNSTTVGRLTKPERSSQGVSAFALCEKRENTTDTPQKRNARNDLFNSRFDAVSKRYLNEVRRSSIIECK